MAETRFVAFGRPAISEDEIEAVVEVLRSGWLSTGHRAHAFEEAFAEYVGASHAVAVNSCTAALHLSLLAAGVGPGDEIVTTPLTFCATANAALHAGATPVFADVDRVSMNVDPAAMAAAITPRTRALLPVHFAGRPVDVAAIRATARRHSLALIEDAAHCVEGVANGEKIGSTADFTCFSFYATKNLVTGEGGMVTTGSADRAAWIRVAALHGLSRDAWARYAKGGSAQYDVVMAGFKYNMPDLLAALGERQLVHIDERLATRVAIWKRYDEELAGLPIARPAAVPRGDVHARHLYTVLIDPKEAGLSRDEFQATLKAQGVGTGIHFRALHLHPFYQERLGLTRGDFPNAEYISDHTLSLPLSAAMSDADVDHVIASVRKTLARPATRRRVLAAAPPARRERQRVASAASTARPASPSCRVARVRV